MKDFFTIGVIVDIIIAAILLFNMISGAKRGFVKTVYKFLKVIIALAVSYMFSAPLAQYLKTTDFYQKLLLGIKENVGIYFAENFKPDFSRISETNPELSKLLSFLGRTPEQIAGEYERLAPESAGETLAERMTDFIVEPACDGIVKVISFVAIFVASLLVLYIVMKLLNLFASIPGIRFLNKTLGLAAGIVVALTQIFVISALFELALPYLAGLDIGITPETVHESSLYSFVVSLNPLTAIFGISA